MRSPSTSSQYQGTFHFINKDVSNLTSRDKDEALLIRSHVTNKYFQWAKKHRNKTWLVTDGFEQRKLGVDDPPWSYESNPTNPDPYYTEARKRRSQVIHVSGKTITWQLGSGTAGVRDGRRSSFTSTTDSCGRSWVIEEDSPVSRDTGVLHYKPTLLYQPDSSTAADRVCCPEIQKEALLALREFFLVYTTTSSNTARSRQQIASSWKAHENSLLRDPRSLYGWLGSYLTIKALYIDPSLYTVLWPQALRHQNRALALLRTSIFTGESRGENILSCIRKISAASFFAGDMESFWRHTDFQRKYIVSLGGLGSLSPMTKIHVILIENAYCRFSLCRPYYHHSMFDPGPLRDQPHVQRYISQIPDIEKPGQGLDEAVFFPNDSMSEALALFIQAHRDFLEVTALASSITTSDPEGADVLCNWLVLRRASLSCWTMTLFSDITESITLQLRLSRAVRRQLQASLCLAVSYLWSFILGFNAPAQQWLLYIPIHKLRPQLELLLHLMSTRLIGAAITSSGTDAIIPSTGLSSHREYLLFLFFPGTCAEQIGIDAGKRAEINGKWHSERFLAVSKILGLRTWREAKKILDRFIYKEEVLDRFLEGVWEERTAMNEGNHL